MKCKAAPAGHQWPGSKWSHPARKGTARDATTNPMSLPTQDVRPPALPYQGLLEVSESITRHGDLVELLHDMGRRLRPVVPFDFISLMLHDDDDDVMRLHVLESERPHQVYHAPDAVPAESPGVVVWRTQQPMLIADFEQETRFPDMTPVWRGFGMRSGYYLPLTTAQRRLGTIHFASARAPSLRCRRPGAVPAGGAPGGGGRGQRPQFRESGVPSAEIGRRARPAASAAGGQQRRRLPPRLARAVPEHQRHPAPRRAAGLRQPGPLRRGPARPPRPRPRLPRRQGAAPGRAGRPLRRRARGPGDGNAAAVRAGARRPGKVRFRHRPAAAGRGPRRPLRRPARLARPDARHAQRGPPRRPGLHRRRGRPVSARSPARSPWPWTTRWPFTRSRNSRTSWPRRSSTWRTRSARSTVSARSSAPARP